MSNIGNDIKLCLLKATSILQTLFVIIMISSCSSEVPQLCNVGITLEEDYSRTLSAEINPLKNYTIYYKSIYRGSDPSKAYGDMSNSSSFNKLTSSGILVSQGLWEIQAIFKETDQDDTYTPTEGELIASSGNIYINLNTHSIAVSFTSNEGYVRLTQYELRSVPNSITDASISVNAYKYNTETSSFDSTAIPLTLKQSEKLKSGVYYAVVEVKGTVSNTSKTLFTDCIGFVVRSGLTTIITGSCNNYDGSVSTPTKIDVNTKGEGNTIIPETDLKNFDNKENTFIDNTIYVLPNNGEYIMIPDVDENGKFIASPEKIIDGNKTVTIDLNGKNMINVNSVTKSLFKIETGSTLNLINSGKKEAYVGTKASLDPRAQTSFKVDGGKLNIATSTSTKSIVLKGCPAIGIDIGEGESRHAPIDITKNGGVVNLDGTSDAKITIEESVKGIATIENETATTDKFIVNINLKYASIKTQGSIDIPNYGIYLDGRGKGGSIQIDIENLADNKSISTTGSSGSAKGYGIYIIDFKGSITINIKDNKAKIQSEDGYGIYIADSCTGKITIDNKGTVSGKTAAMYLRGDLYKEKLGKKTYTKDPVIQTNN